MTLELQTSGHDQEIYYDAFGPEELQESWQLNEREILHLAGEIGEEWMSIGIYLGYKRATLNHLEEVFPRQPRWRNFMMIAEWCDVVSRLGLNVRQHLANIMSNANQLHIADALCTDYKALKITNELFRHIDNISFDKPLSMALGRYDIKEIFKAIGKPLQVRFEIQLSGSQLITPLGLTQNMQMEPLSISAGKRQNAIKGLELPHTDILSLGTLRLSLPSDCENSSKLSLSKLLSDLSLERYYPEGITLSDIREIKRFGVPLAEKALPWLLLTKIIMLNYNAREEDLNSLFEQTRSQGSMSDPDSDDDLFEDTTVRSINPLDLFYVTFLCCNQMLKQEIISKLFTCRLAVPFIYKDSQGHLTLSQFGLRTIFMDKRINEKSVQLDALHHEAIIVSFVRIGRQSLSKSKIMNEILCDQYHPTFFNRDCPLGTTSRKVADGIVEASWFIPSGRESDIFTRLTMFLNLRGDCIAYENEIEILCKLSHVVVVHADVEQLTSNRTKDILLKIHEFNKPVIYALESSCKHDVEPNQIWRTYKRSMQKFKTQMKVFDLKTSRQTKSSSDITKEMRKLLLESIANKPAIKLIHLIDSLGISDENQISTCARSMKMALKVMASISQSIHTEKENVLPLQGKLWSSWSSNLKKLYKSKSDKEIESLKAVMFLTRAEQVHKLEQLHPFMSLFLCHLISEYEHEENTDGTVFFLSWMKIFLDEKCREIVPQLIFKYQQCWLAMRSAVENNFYDAFPRLRKDVDKAEQDLVEASFGLEHLIRELGQIYEAVNTNYAYVSSSVSQFPVVVSRLLQNGYPLEIMDGDTAMVPKLWIEAVFKQLIKDIGDKKLLTISVLGIQSSGKSTLLNAMFGLQFAVSAGRCTRGVFAQLVKVKEGILPYEYVLVIDTEGLRAPELSDRKYTHDNELATFVLGLGNITIINIKGENTQEMEDVLQIAVHAFLRLKMANRNLQMQQTCIFVHQNVPAIDASTKMTHARQKMMDKLDKLTNEAAKQEGLADINSFSQVIEVDPQAHMWYFSDLWYGDPPMAPINLGYSRNVQEVKRHILFDFAQKKKTFLSISETTTRMTDLLTGILSDNFVFSFRNSLEVKAYHVMDAQFHKIAWDIEKKMHQFVQTEASVRIIRCANEHQLGQEYEYLTNTLYHFLMQQLSEQTVAWNNFIDCCSLRDIMDQWRQNRILNLNECVQDLIRFGNNIIQSIKTQKMAELINLKRRPMHESVLREKAEHLANQFKGKSLTHTQLEMTFHETWAKWVDGIDPVRTPEKRSVKSEVERILYELFVADGPLLTKELNRDTGIKYEDMTKLKNSISQSDLQTNHISISQNWLQKIIRNKKDASKQQASIIINMILESIDTILSNILTDDSPFQRTYVKKIFMTLNEGINSHNAGIDNLSHFTFTAAFRVMMAVHVSRYITVVFTNMDTRYEAKHNIMAQMENYKHSVWQYFKDVFENKLDEVKIANLLINTIGKIVKREIDSLLPFEVVKTIIDEHFSTKYSLIIAIMKDLAELNNFDAFFRYIHDAENFTLDWITNFTNNRIFHNDTQAKNRYMTIVTKFIDMYITFVQQCADFATLKSSTKTQLWLFEFETSLAKHLPVVPSTFATFHVRKCLDLRSFHNYFSDQLMILKESLKNKFMEESKRPIKWTGGNPYSKILDKLWGCKKRCPFCKETCQKTRQEHRNEKHTCIQHRPPGIVGVVEVNTNVMVWKSCNFEVYSKDKFYCGVIGRKCQKSGLCKGLDSRGELHNFRDYRYFVPDWEIEPSALTDTSMYWMWFVYTYRKKLAAVNNYKIPSYIAQWSSITKSMAVKSLEQRGVLLLD